MMEDKDFTEHYCFECDRTHAGPYLDMEDVWHFPNGWDPPMVLGDCNE